MRMVEDDKAKESYLQARGWVAVQRPIPYVEHWMLAWQAHDRTERLLGHGALTLDAAVKRQLRWDAHALVYFLETVNNGKPESQLLIGGQLLMMVFAALKEMVKDKEFMLDGARKLGQVMQELEGDPEHKANVAALGRAYEMGKRSAGGSQGGGGDGKPN